jgi:aminoglycoside phosphotransferase (APT) family kinase protein
MGDHAPQRGRRWAIMLKMAPSDETRERSPPHGFELSAADERLLRAPIPAPALEWAAAAVGPGARVREARALAGGTSSAVHELSVDDAGGHRHELVLRRFVRLDWLAEVPDLAEREATALRLLEAGRLPTPRLVAVDPNGAAAGVPAVLMTRLPGQVVWDPPVVEEFLRALAEPLPAVHATTIAAGTSVPEYRPYRLEMHRAPAWASRPEVWVRAIDVVEGPAPEGDRAFIHRDYHPGNVLWLAGQVSGLVDWVNASIGSPWADVGHCRVNIASELGQEAAERFLALYRTASGRNDEYHPYWDISAAIGGLDESADEQPSQSDENFLATAVARL